MDAKESRKNRSMKLFCFTYAGGTADFFNHIEDLIPDIEFVKIEYSGHGKRRNEPYYHSFDELTDDMYNILREHIEPNEKYALFGYSMGAIAASELLRMIIDKSEIEQPTHVFLAAHEPHSKMELEKYSDTELDDYVKERTIRFGGVPERLIRNSSFWRVYLPVYRADYSIIVKYNFDNLSFNTIIPATIFYSEADTPLTEMKKWTQLFQDNCKFYGFKGSHFFINEHSAEMAQIIKERLIV